MSAAEQLIPKRTPAKRKARQLVANPRQERPDYAYLKEIFRQLRVELGIVVPRTPKRLPYVPSEEEIRRYYETVWRTRKARRPRGHQDPAVHRCARQRARRALAAYRRDSRSAHPQLR